jgi:hypothetical protein
LFIIATQLVSQAIQGKAGKPELGDQPGPPSGFQIHLKEEKDERTDRYNFGNMSFRIARIFLYVDICGVYCWLVNP